MTPEEELETKEMMVDVANILQKVFPKMGFILMIFEFGASNRMNYLSNAERKDVVDALKEFIAKTERSWAKDREDGTFGSGGKI